MVEYDVHQYPSEGKVINELAIVYDYANKKSLEHFVKSYAG